MGTRDEILRPMLHCFPIPWNGPLVGIADWAVQMFKERDDAGLYLQVRKDDGIIKSEPQP